MDHSLGTLQAGVEIMDYCCFVVFEFGKQAKDLVLNKAFFILDNRRKKGFFFQKID